ncbi:MAG: hypothetical protein KGP29_05645 [Proteobacteria bacterium]|nr:hypothetical protein [Pseudomonadota bacterium]
MTNRELLLKRFNELYEEEKIRRPSNKENYYERKAKGFASALLGISLIGIVAFSCVASFGIIPAAFMIPAAVATFVFGNIGAFGLPGLLVPLLSADRFANPKKYYLGNATEKLRQELRLDEVKGETRIEGIQRFFGVGRTAEIVRKRHQDFNKIFGINQTPEDKNTLSDRSDLTLLIRDLFPPKSKNNPYERTVVVSSEGSPRRIEPTKNEGSTFSGNVVINRTKGSSGNSR